MTRRPCFEGVNTAIFTNTGASAGVGFAIPVDLVKRVVPQLIEYGAAGPVAQGLPVGDPSLSAAMLDTDALAQAVANEQRGRVV